VKTATIIAVMGAIGLGLALFAAAERSGELPCCATGQSSATSPEVPGAPLVCTLTDKEVRDRREQLGTLLTKAALGAEEIANGYIVSFEKGHGARIAEFIELERTCCPFFEFTLAFAPNDGPITLAIAGPKGSKAFSSKLVESIPKS